MFINCIPDELVRQIGTGNLMAISGGVVVTRSTGITLPVSDGYEVTVDLAFGDTYTVRRTLYGTVLGEEAEVYCDQVGDSAYRASCFHNVAFGNAAVDDTDDPLTMPCDECGAEVGEECRPTCTAAG